MSKNYSWANIILIILAWIIFVGLCIDAGGLITNVIFALVNPGVVKNLWHEINLTNLFDYNRSHFIVLASTISIVTALKATMFYVIIKNLHAKKLTLSQPFNKHTRTFIINLAFISLAIGLFSSSGVRFTDWLVKQGVDLPDTHHLRLGGCDVWLFMCVILFILAQIFKKGIEIQTENDLTV